MSLYDNKKIAFLGLMLALIIILTLVERAFPPWPMLPPQFGRIGLANVIVMYTLLFCSKKEAIFMAILKALFNMLIRGPVAGLLSLSGGLLSVLVMILLMPLIRKPKRLVGFSEVSLSIAGAIGHNIGQLAIAALIMQNRHLFIFYLPILLIAGTVFGMVTGMILIRVAKRW